eukprot:7006751-Pyramimonas_sp.AAC.1
MPFNPSYNCIADDGSSRYRVAQRSTACTAMCATEVLVECQRARTLLRKEPDHLYSGEAEALKATLDKEYLPTQLPNE